METLEQKLQRQLPGAKCRKDTAAPVAARFLVDGWRKSRDGKRWEPAVLATGATEREAIDRAVTLYGSHR